MEVLGDLSADSLCGFIQQNVAAGATVRTDAWQGYRRLAKLGYDHRPKSQRAGLLLGEDVGEVVPRVHRTISNLKTWLRGTYRGVSENHLQVYLDEFVFRFNRRRTPMAAFQTLLGLGARQGPTTYRQIEEWLPGPAELTG